MRFEKPSVSLDSFSVFGDFINDFSVIFFLFVKLILNFIKHFRV